MAQESQLWTSAQATGRLAGTEHASRLSQSTTSGPTEAHWAFLLWHKRHHQLRPQHRCGTQGPLTEKEMTGPVS